MTSLTREKTQEKITFMVYYQGFLAVAAVLLFYTRLDVYLEKQGVGIPLYWMIFFILASIPLFATIFKRLHYIPHSVLFWCGVYLALPLISIVISSKIPEQQFLEDHCRTIIFLLLMIVIFSQYTWILKWAKLAVLGATIANVFMYVYEFFNPLSFYLEQHSPGRSSGFYHDSNSAAWAIIAGMIFTIDWIKPKYRIFYALLILVGITPTFSRSGFLSWVVVILLLLLTKVIPRSQIPPLFLSGFMVISILSTQLNNLSYLKTADGTDLFNEDSLARIEFLLNPLAQDDSSSGSRLSHVDEAWEKFARHPFMGNGLGSAQNAKHISARGTAQRSHNIYLDLMVEYGFLGALLYPWLLLASVWKVQGELKKQAIAFVGFLVIWGFSSHTIITSFDNLTYYALMANVAKQSPLERPIFG